MKARNQPHFGPSYTPPIASAVASCTAAIACLDARISVSAVASAWEMRAAWSGYAQALQLQGVEIDDIDVFSWGCGLKIPGRPTRATNLDEFAAFADWRSALRGKDALAWRDSLPSIVAEPADAAEHPPLVRALDRIRQLARVDGSIEPWLGLPFALRDQKISTHPIPCLAGGAKSLRLKFRPLDADWLAIFRSLTVAATSGLERLDHLERLYRDAQRAVVREFRPGALPSLIALTMHRPIVSPQYVAQTLDLSIAGASKLLDRGVASGLLVEITRRRTWRVFLAADLAITFGYASPKRGRPKLEPSPLPADRDLSDVFDAFDDEMARIDRLLARHS